MVRRQYEQMTRMVRDRAPGLRRGPGKVCRRTRGGLQRTAAQTNASWPPRPRTRPAVTAVLRSPVLLHVDLPGVPPLVQAEPLGEEQLRHVVDHRGVPAQ